VPVAESVIVTARAAIHFQCLRVWQTVVVSCSIRFVFREEINGRKSQGKPFDRGPSIAGLETFKTAEVGGPSLAVKIERSAA
jgi:hypothetical protein